jgi:hypothetical protein
MNVIIDKQNDPANMKLLKASTIAYSKAKRGEVRITYFFIFLAIAFPLCYLFIKDDNVKHILFGCSFLLTVIILIFTDRFKGNTSKGAIFKEEFDTIIFELPWKSTLKKPDRIEIIHYSKKYKGTEINDWYSTSLSPSIEHNMAVAILQHSNTSWDIDLRKIYRRWLFSILVFYSIALAIIIVLLKVDALTIFLLLFSLLSFYSHFISLIRGHSAVIDKREAISKHLDEIIHRKKEIGINELRDIQDEIFITRQESAKVPDFFFQWYKKQMNSEAEEYIEEVNNLYR